MKRLLLSLFVIIAAVSFTNATDVTIPTNSENDTWAGGEDGYSATIDGFTIAYTRSASNAAVAPSGDHIRVYKGATLSVKSVSGEAITGVVLNCVNNAKYCSDITVNGETVTANTTDFTISWTGSTAEFIAEATNSQLRIMSITVTTGEAPAVAIPVFNPGEGTYYGPVEVTLSCATEGADIWYKLGDSAPQFTPYDGPIKVESTTTIIAMASVGITFSDAARATYTISEAKSVENIADFYTQSQSLVVKFANPVNVLYQSGAYLFVQDATGALQIYGNVGQTYKNGDIIPAGFMGSVGEFGEVIQLSSPVAETFAAAEEGAVIKPTVVKVNEITETMLNRLIQVNNATVNLEGGKTLTDESGTITLFARFNEVSLPADDKAYDVTAIVSSFKGALQLFPISFTLTNTGIANVDNAASRVEAGYNVINVNAAEDAQVTIVNSVGQVLVSKAVTAGANAIPVSAGFYLVKVGDVVTKVVVR